MTRSAAVTLAFTLLASLALPLKTFSANVTGTGQGPAQILGAAPVALDPAPTSAIAPLGNLIATKPTWVGATAPIRQDQPATAASIAPISHEAPAPAASGAKAAQAVSAMGETMLPALKAADQPISAEGSVDAGRAIQAALDGTSSVKADGVVAAAPTSQDMLHPRDYYDAAYAKAVEVAQAHDKTADKVYFESVYLVPGSLLFEFFVTAEPHDGSGQNGQRITIKASSGLLGPKAIESSFEEERQTWHRLSPPALNHPFSFRQRALLSPQAALELGTKAFRNMGFKSVALEMTNLSFGYADSAFRRDFSYQLSQHPKYVHVNARTGAVRTTPSRTSVFFEKLSWALFRIFSGHLIAVALFFCGVGAFAVTHSIVLAFVSVAITVLLCYIFMCLLGNDWGAWS